LILKKKFLICALATFSFCVYKVESVQTGPGSTSHARRLGGLANGRPGLRRATRIKGGHSDNPAVIRKEYLPDTLQEAKTHTQLIYKNSRKYPAAAEPSRTEETAGKAVTQPSHHCSAKLVAPRSRIVHDKLAVLSVY
jgi:hypothetical protein